MTGPADAPAMATGKGGEVDRCAMPPAGPSHLAFSFTNRCNLRCVYCPQGSHPDSFHAETPREQVDAIIAYALRHKIARISIGYYGETMLVDGWERMVEPLFGHGVRLNLVSNFSKVMTPAEVAAVSRFDEVQMSIDSVDPAVLKQVRKAVDVRTIVFNTHLIRACALRRGWPMPRIIWTTVLTDSVAEGLPDLVAMAISCGAPALNCVEVAYIDGADAGAGKVSHLNDAPDDLFCRGFVAVQEARRLALRHGLDFSLGGAERMDRRARAIMPPDDYEQATRIIDDLAGIPADRRIFIYGAGAGGRTLRAMLPPGRVCGFIDSVRDGAVDDLPLLSFSRYRAGIDPADLILIGSSFEREIEAGLLAHDVGHYRRIRPGALTGHVKSVGAPPTSGEIHRHGIQGDYFFSGDGADSVPPGMTRLCAAPWTEMFFDPKGEVYACCFRGHVMGRLRDGTGIDEILAGEPYRQLRRQLLSGEGLDPECRFCTAVAVGAPDEMQDFVDSLFARAAEKSPSS